MNIIKAASENKVQTAIEIVSAVYAGDLAIRILFNDSVERTVDFKPFLIKSAHPSISKYLDESLFKKFNIINGNINWNDYDLIFPIHDLYEGTIN